MIDEIINEFINIKESRALYNMPVSFLLLFLIIRLTWSVNSNSTRKDGSVDGSIPSEIRMKNDERKVVKWPGYHPFRTQSDSTNSLSENTLPYDLSPEVNNETEPRTNLDGFKKQNNDGYCRFPQLRIERNRKKCINGNINNQTRYNTGDYLGVEDQIQTNRWYSVKSQVNNFKDKKNFGKYPMEHKNVANLPSDKENDNVENEDASSISDCKKDHENVSISSNESCEGRGKEKETLDISNEKGFSVQNAAINDESLHAAIVSHEIQRVLVGPSKAVVPSARSSKYRKSFDDKIQSGRVKKIITEVFYEEYDEDLGLSDKDQNLYSNGRDIVVNDQ
ncbi:hypothetical protein THOM_1698 [Trachipleistophora hominis]|uniref:Uncharacterized protein n=1 Tax=Trachipleistophora hominis TaxID=72359 RepID=L7JVM7_TRAHO|nr:hypothetical protein THOM_1698 [Trachipleistophora hominis]